MDMRKGCGLIQRFAARAREMAGKDAGPLCAERPDPGFSVRWRTVSRASCRIAASLRIGRPVNRADALQIDG